MFWLMGIYYTAVLGFIFLAYSISYDEPVVFGAVVFLLVLLCAIPAVIFFNQKKEYKKDIEFVKKSANAQVEEFKAKTEQKLNGINNELERLRSINVLETDKLLLNLDKHLKAMVPIMSGEAYEVYVGYKLAYVGWSDITFTPVTGDYGADIIATDKNGLKVCIQCKRYDSPVGIDAVQEVIAAKQYYGANRAVVATNSVMTQQACNIAQKTGVELWERFI